MSCRLELPATDNTSLCPLRVAFSLPVATSHNFISSPHLCEASTLPGVRAERQGSNLLPWLPLNVGRSFPRLHLPSQLDPSRCCPRRGSCRPGCTLLATHRQRVSLKGWPAAWAVRPCKADGGTSTRRPTPRPRCHPLLSSHIRLHRSPLFVPDDFQSLRTLWTPVHSLRTCQEVDTENILSM